LLPKPRALVDDVRSSHQFEEEIGAASSENRLFIAKMEFSVQTAIISSDQLGFGVRQQYQLGEDEKTGAPGRKDTLNRFTSGRLL
jgi:hypothetical protein